MLLLIWKESHEIRTHKVTRGPDTEGMARTEKNRTEGNLGCPEKAHRADSGGHGVGGDWGSPGRVAKWKRLRDPYVKNPEQAHPRDRLWIGGCQGLGRGSWEQGGAALQVQGFLWG